MATLKTSLMPPSIVENEQARLDLRKEKNRNAKIMDELAEVLERWRKFKNTPHGQVIIEVADFEIKSLEDRLSQSMAETAITYNDINVAREVQAEWRGSLRTWKNIKFNLVEYEQRLTELKRMTDEEEKTQEEAREKLLRKYD